MTELRKQPALGAEAILTLLFCGVVLVGLYISLGASPPFYGALAYVIIFVPLTWRKFARSITVDFSARSVHAVGVIPLFHQTFTFDELEYVRCPAVAGLGRTGACNVVFRCLGAFQPLLFEVRSETEKAQARELLAALRAAIPEKMRDDALGGVAVSAGG